MLPTALLSFAAGVLSGNGFPHFVNGITKERFRSVFGGAPAINFVVGWAGAILARLALYGAHIMRHPAMAAWPGAIGPVIAGMFHPGIGAFGRRDPVAQGSAAAAP